MSFVNIEAILHLVFFPNYSLRKEADIFDVSHHLTEIIYKRKIY